MTKKQNRKLQIELNHYKIVFDELTKQYKELESMRKFEIETISKSFKIDNQILTQSLESAENALREKEIIITYLETRGNENV